MNVFRISKKKVISMALLDTYLREWTIKLFKCDICTNWKIMLGNVHVVRKI